MPHAPDHEITRPVYCRAVPNASRRGWRTDRLCASIANTEVEFCGRLVPVCRIHSATYGRWGPDAEAKARELWGWLCPDPPA